MKRHRPHQYIVYTDRPPYPAARPCTVRTMRIPYGKDFDDMRDYLPPSVGKMAVVTASSSAEARDHARTRRGIACTRRK